MISTRTTYLRSRRVRTLGRARGRTRSARTVGDVSPPARPNPGAGLGVAGGDRGGVGGRCPAAPRAAHLHAGDRHDPRSCDRRGSRSSGAAGHAGGRRPIRRRAVVGTDRRPRCRCSGRWSRVRAQRRRRLGSSRSGFVRDERDLVGEPRHDPHAVAPAALRPAEFRSGAGFPRASTSRARTSFRSS